MMGERRAPGVEDGGDADPGTEVLRVGGDGQHRIGRGLEQQVIEGRLIVEGDRGNLGKAISALDRAEKKLREEM